MALSALIRDQKEDVLLEWESIVRALTSARQLTVPALRNHLPDFLEWLCLRLDGKEHTFPHEQAWEHAVERVREGYDLSEVISEYAVLRDCLLEVWERNRQARVSPREVRILNQAIDDAIAFSAVYFARSRLMRSRDAGRPIAPSTL